MPSISSVMSTCGYVRGDGVGKSMFVLRVPVVVVNAVTVCGGRSSDGNEGLSTKQRVRVLHTWQPRREVGSSPKAWSSMSSSTSSVSGSASNRSSSKMTWQVLQAHTPSHAPYEAHGTGRGSRC